MSELRILLKFRTNFAELPKYGERVDTSFKTCNRSLEKSFYLQHHETLTHHEFAAKLTYWISVQRISAYKFQSILSVNLVISKQNHTLRF